MILSTEALPRTVRKRKIKGFRSFSPVDTNLISTQPKFIFFCCLQLSCQRREKKVGSLYSLLLRLLRETLDSVVCCLVDDDDRDETHVP